MNALVRLGWMTALSSMARRAAFTSSAAETSFRRYPETPAWMASAMAGRVSSTVNRITRVPGCSSRMIRVASMPPIPGMCTSMNTTSGWSSATRSTASSPVEASPTISTSSESASVDWMPARVIGWSSAIRIRMGTVVTSLAGRLKGRR